MIRKTPVAATPEEQVRQALLSFMIDKAGYPKGLIGVELSLSSLPQLKGIKTPKRRADILVFSSAMTPLVLIECKAVPLTDATIRQVIGYNLFIKAPYIVIANHEEIRTGTFNGQDWIFLPGLPNYSTIMHQ